MKSNLSFLTEDEISKIVNRYEAHMRDKGISGYFDVEEFEVIADFYYDNGQMSDGLKALEKGLQLHPKSYALEVKKIRILLTTGEDQKAKDLLKTLPKSDDYELTLLKVEVLLRSGSYLESLNLSRELMKSDQNDKYSTGLGLAYIFISLHFFEDALEFLKESEKINPTCLDTLHGLAFCYSNLGNNMEALETYERITRLDPFSAEAWYNIGLIEFSNKNFSEALNAYDYALTVNPNDPKANLQKAHTLSNLQLYREAIEEFLIVAGLSTDTWDKLDSWLEIGFCYEQLELYSDAIRYYQMVLDESPVNYQALSGIAICLLDQEKYLESVAYLKQALELNDDAPDAWAYMAEAMIGLNNSDDALIAYQRSIKLEPNQPNALMAMANIYMEKSDFANALLYYQQAQQVDVDFELENIQLLLAVANYKTGRIEASAVALELALAENLDALILFQELCPEAHF